MLKRATKKMSCSAPWVFIEGQKTSERSTTKSRVGTGVVMTSLLGEDLVCGKANWFLQS